MTNKRTSNGNGNGNCKDEIQGSFDCAVHDETVNGFAQDDVCMRFEV
jgi:hypothetical protein